MVKTVSVDGKRRPEPRHESHRTAREGLLLAHLRRGSRHAVAEVRNRTDVQQVYI